MSTTQIIALVVALVIIAALVVGAVMVMRRRALRQRFGPEYDRLVAESENRSAAEAELRERERRHAELQLTELSPQAKAGYAQEWAQVQTRFVEQPAQTVAAADHLVTRLIHERGYPTEDYDEAVAHLSVEHSHTLGHYRDAHDIYLTNERGEATTEQLRQALMHYRAIFADILGEPALPDTAAEATGEPVATEPTVVAPTTATAPTATAPTAEPTVVEPVDEGPDELADRRTVDTDSPAVSDTRRG